MTRGFAVSELADRVGELLGDPVLRHRLGAAARAGAGRFSANEAAADYEARLAMFGATHVRRRAHFRSIFISVIFVDYRDKPGLYAQGIPTRGDEGAG